MRVETRRLTFQITVELGSEKVVKFSTYGHELSMRHIRTLLCDDTYVSCSAIDVLITFIETATPCLGQPVPEDTNEYLKVPVCNSRVISISIPGTGTDDETCLVSLSRTFLYYSCPNLITNAISCHECSKIHRLFGKRERKREKNMDTGSQVLHCVQELYANRFFCNFISIFKPMFWKFSSWYCHIRICVHAKFYAN